MARILVIDGDGGTLLTCLSRNPDWTIGQVTTVEGFHQKLMDQKFDLIIINETFAGDDVLELLESGERYAPDLPILLITCSHDETSTIHSLQLGVVSFVPATASATELYHVITRVLALSRFSRTQQKVLTQCQSCEFSFELGNRREEIPAVVAYLRDVLAAVAGVGYRDQMRVAVAIEEALQNAVIHGNLEVCSSLRELNDDQFTNLIEERLNTEPYQQRRVQLEAKLSLQSIELVITDAGPGFDLSTLPDPTSPEHLLQPHGRGLLLMRAFMDEVQYHPPGNKLSMKKSFPQ